MTKEENIPKLVIDAGKTLDRRTVAVRFYPIVGLLPSLAAPRLFFPLFPPSPSGTSSLTLLNPSLDHSYVPLVAYFQLTPL